MIEERLSENASLYALGALEGAEAREFEALLRENAELRQLVGELANASRALAGTVPKVEPPVGLREKILAPVRSEPIVLRPAGSGQWLSWWPVALAAGLAIVCAVLAQQNARQKEDYAQLTARFEVATNDLTKTIENLRETNLLANVRVAVLSSLMAESPKTVAVSLWDSQKQTGEFVCQGLQPLASDQDYQLWIIDPKAAAPVDAGVFQVDKDGNVRLTFKTRQHVQDAGKFAVTREPKGGKPAPSGPMVLIGS